MPRIFLILLCLASAWAQARADTFIFSAPPVRAAETSRTLYEPLMALLSSDTGHTFRYVHASNWFSYQGDMRRGEFDLLLDEAHLAGWRIAALDHVPLARARQRVRFVVIATRAGRIYSKEDLIGRALCAPQQPALGTLSVLRKFNSPFQVPRLVEIDTPIERVQSLLAGVCAGAVLARHDYTGTDEIRAVANRLKIITQTDSYPGLTLTASSDMPEEVRAAVQRVVLSRAGGQAIRVLRDRLVNGSGFIEAAPEEYEGLNELLRGFPGFTQ